MQITREWWSTLHWRVLLWPLDVVGDAFWLTGDRLHTASLWIHDKALRIYWRIDPVGCEFRRKTLMNALEQVEKDKELEQ
jgi:hypothetical protein